jgi:hypothetical protein
MTRKRWYRIAEGLVTRAACVALLTCCAAGTAAAQDAANRYAELLADADLYTEYNAQLQRLLESQMADIESLGAQIAGLDATAGAMEPLLDRMFTSLEEFVAGDLPFLKAERTARMETLGMLMAEEGAIAEKFRRLLEAYQIEIEYGRTMDAYPGTLEDGREVHFLHLGRVSLIYRTTDGSETAYWDADAGEWVIDKNHTRAVEEALRMAEETLAPDLVTLPVPAARESSS